MRIDKTRNQPIKAAIKIHVPFEERLTCSVAEACDAIGLSRAKIYELIAGGAVDSLTIGRRRLIRVPSLKRLVNYPEAGAQ